MPRYYYVRGTDGTDETFDIYRGDQHVHSVHFWEDAAEAEAEARLLVAVLSAAEAG